ncbi:MAG: hypothetical protein ABIN21_05270 [candidate division WOR-3 bacterium]
MEITLLFFSIILKGELLLKDSIPLKDYKVTFYELDSTLSLIDSSFTKTDHEGKFLFKNDKKGIYIVKVNYQNVRYRTDPILKDDDKIRLSVYDTVSNYEQMVLQRAHIAFIPSPGLIQVIEVYNFFNAHNKTVKREFRIPLPHNATHIFSPQGVLPFEFKLIENSFIYKEGFKPGLKTISLLYHLTFDKIKFERKIPFITNEFLVMLPKELELKTKINFEKENLQTPQGNFSVYSFKNLKANEILSFEIKVKKDEGLKNFILPFLLLILFLIFLLFIFRRKWKKKEVISE